jgi:hypothetical protein
MFFGLFVLGAGTVAAVAIAAAAAIPLLFLGLLGLLVFFSSLRPVLLACIRLFVRHLWELGMAWGL